MRPGDNPPTDQPHEQSGWPQNQPGYGQQPPRGRRGPVRAGHAAEPVLQPAAGSGRRLRAGRLRPAGLRPAGRRLRAGRLRPAGWRLRPGLRPAGLWPAGRRLRAGRLRPAGRRLRPGLRPAGLRPAGRRLRPGLRPAGLRPGWLRPASGLRRRWLRRPAERRRQQQQGHLDRRGERRGGRTDRHAHRRSRLRQRRARSRRPVPGSPSAAHSSSASASGSGFPSQSGRRAQSGCRRRPDRLDAVDRRFVRHDQLDQLHHRRAGRPRRDRPHDGGRVRVAGQHAGRLQPGHLQRLRQPAVRPQLTKLYGKSFGLPGDDQTGGDSHGSSARYVMQSKDGGTLNITFTKQGDGHYICTAFTFTG